MTLEERLHAGSRAKEVLENEQFQAAFQAIETEIITQWKNSPARDRDGRESLWTYLSLLNKVQAHLKSVMETGKLAELEREHKLGVMQRSKEWQ